MPNPQDDHAMIPIGPNGVELKDIDAMFRFARCYLQSGLAPGSFRNEQQLVIAWAKAAELGLSPLQALEGMAIINNRVGIMGDLALAMVESSGQLAEKKIEYTGEGEALTCTITLTRKGRKPAAHSFGVKDARRAGLWGKAGPWTQYSDRMLYYRALGFALRDEFPDILKGIKTLEELADYPKEARVRDADTYEDDIDDEQKIRDNQAHDEAAKAAGVKFVESTPGSKRPTPAEAAEPAFPEDRKPKFGEQLAKEFAGEPPDELDMTPAPAKEEEPPKEPAWKSHVIMSIPKDIGQGQYHGKKIGDLTSAQLRKIELQWLPAIREKWDEASDVQKAEAPIFEAAIAYYKMAKPW